MACSFLSLSVEDKVAINKALAGFSERTPANNLYLCESECVCVVMYTHSQLKQINEWMHARRMLFQCTNIYNRVCIYKNCVWNNQELVLRRKTKAAVGKQLFGCGNDSWPLFTSWWNACNMIFCWFNAYFAYFSQHSRSGRKYLKMSLRSLSPGRATKCENRIGNRERGAAFVYVCSVLAVTDCRRQF